MNNYLNICITVKAERYIIVVFGDNTQHFERCVQILESVEKKIKVQEINKHMAKLHIDFLDRFNFD